MDVVIRLTGSQLVEIGACPDATCNKWRHIGVWHCPLGLVGRVSPSEKTYAFYSQIVRSVIAPSSLTPERSAHLRSAFVKLAPLRSAPLRFAS